eukprot:jgi/Galph1/3965/GphlegSOOS_G2625.1
MAFWFLRIDPRLGSIVGRWYHSSNRNLCIASFVERELLKMQQKQVDIVSNKLDPKPIAENTSTELQTICEGKAKVMYNSGQVFYNKAQAFNRDLSVLMLNDFVETAQNEMKEKQKIGNARRAAWKGITATDNNCPFIKHLKNSEEDSFINHFSVFEAFSATGLRSIRYALEVPHLYPIIANDRDQASYETIQKSIEINHNAGEKVFASLGEATQVMYQHRQTASQFDIIDLDPYGTAAPFVDAAMQAIRNRGLLCVTSTDMRSLAGIQGGICYARYGAVPCTWPKAYRNEVGLRILLSFLQQSASRYGKHIEPMVAVFIDFYVRVFVRVYESGLEAQRSIQRQAYIYACNSCPSFYLQPLGVVKNQGQAMKRLSLFGPIYTGPIYQEQVVQRLLTQLQTNSRWAYLPCKERLIGFLTVLSNECADIPLYMDCNDFAKLLRISPPPLASLREAIRKKGYRVSTSHTSPTAVKTNAPLELVYDIMRIWVKTGVQGKIKPHDTATRILATEPTWISADEIDFSIHKDGLNSYDSITRYPPLEKHHGPGKQGQDLQDEL